MVVPTWNSADGPLFLYTKKEEPARMEGPEAKVGMRCEHRPHRLPRYGLPARNLP